MTTQADVFPGLRGREDGERFAAHYHFGAVRDADAARDWISRLDVTTTAERLDELSIGNERLVNVGLTWSGAVALRGADQAALDFTGHGAFVAGLAARHAAHRGGLLGNIPLPGGAPVDVVVIVAAGADPDAASAWEDLRPSGSGIAWATHVAVGAPLRERREHFGFIDGTAQPSALGSTAVVPRGRGWIVGGSFGAYVEFEQDVDGFAAWCTRAAATISAQRAASGVGGPLDPGTIASLLLGRDRPTGAPLTAALPAGGWGTEAWRLPVDRGADPNGLRCPFSAHVRKMHDVSGAHGIVRRGIPFSEVGDDGRLRRGLLFVGYQASIEAAFEELVGAWGNTWWEPERSRGGGVDPLVSASARSALGTVFEVTNPNGRGSAGAPLRSTFVTPRNGCYFFLPSQPSLRVLRESST